MTGKYRYFISVTSQLPFCGIPFRLDSYSTCQFACRYCFASTRGGARTSKRIFSASPKSLRRRFDNIRQLGARSAVDEMLQAKIPLHFGGMSDPFMPKEELSRITYSLLEVLADNNYPVVISTKGTIGRTSDYAALLKRGRTAVQVSFSSFDEEVARKLEPGVPSPQERIQLLQTLADTDIPTSVRLQPYIPTHLEDAFKLIDACTTAGVHHFAVEHLKLPIEDASRLRRSLAAATGIDLYRFYADSAASRVGREWVLPPVVRVEAVSALMRYSKRAGLSFGAADSDLLHWSDGQVCCSGADLLGMGPGMRFNFLTAVRAGMHTGNITFQSIAAEWRPSRSISQFINSSSRTKGGRSVDEYIRARWNGVTNGPSPLSFFGVVDSDRYDDHGYKIYSFDNTKGPSTVASADGAP